MAQREIAALHLKRTSLKEKINVTSASRTASFNQQSDHWTETIQNTGKATVIAGNEAKLKTELAFVERDINHYKHIFGVTLFQQFSILEDTKNWLPTDREIRSFYDNTRKDIDNYKSRIASKEQEIRDLDGTNNNNHGTGGTSSSNSAITNYEGPNSALSKNAMTSNYSNNNINNNTSNLTMSTGIIDAPPISQQQQFSPSFYDTASTSQSSSSYPANSTISMQQSSSSSNHDFLGGGFGGIQQPQPPLPLPTQHSSEAGLFRYGVQQQQPQPSNSTDAFDGFL
jgi:hypothetical protein